MTSSDAPHSTAPDASPPAVDPAGLTVEEAARAFKEAVGKFFDWAPSYVAASPYREHEDELRKEIVRTRNILSSSLAQRSAPDEGSDGTLTAQPTGIPAAGEDLVEANPTPDSRVRQSVQALRTALDASGKEG